MQDNQLRPSQIWIVLSFLIIYFVWGSTYLFNKILLDSLPPYLLSSTRFIVAALFVLAYCMVSGRRVEFSVTKIKNTFFLGFLFLTLGNGCLVYGLQYVDSGFAALIIAAVPLVVLIMMYLLRGVAMTALSIIGVALGLVGIYLLVAQTGISTSSDNWMGFVAILVSMLSWSYASIIVSELDLPKDSLINTGMQMFFGGILLLIISVALGEWSDLDIELTKGVVLSMIYLIIFGSIVAFTAFNFLLLHVSPAKVATSNYVNPVIAMLLGWLVLDESITNQSILAAIVLLTGVYFVNKSKENRRALK